MQKVTFGSKACGLDPFPRDFENMDDEEIAIDLPYEFVSFMASKRYRIVLHHYKILALNLI